MGWFIGVGIIVLVGGLLYWQLILAEGAYLGRRLVALLYDGSAHLYDRIKEYDPGYEQWFLGLPLSRALAAFPDPLVLDVATGTGRLARTLCAQPGFHGRLIGVDFSRKMLTQAVAATEVWQTKLMFLWQDASELPFPDATFDAVACLEALEFMPNPERVLQEMARVLRPGGIFLTTNRIGPDARWLPGRAQSSETFSAMLQALPLEMVRSQPWQEDYDLFWAVKPGVNGPAGLRRFAEVLRCPLCHTPLRQEATTWHCDQAHSFQQAADGVIELARLC